MHWANRSSLLVLALAGFGLAPPGEAGVELEP
jgi:hypothetical protein